MRDPNKPDHRPAWLKACDDLKKTVIVVQPEPVVYKAHPVGPRPVRRRKGWRKPPPRVKRPLTARELKRSNPDPNPMPTRACNVMAYHRKTGRPTPNADARRPKASAQ